MRKQQKKLRGSVVYQTKSAGNPEKSVKTPDGPENTKSSELYIPVQ